MLPFDPSLYTQGFEYPQRPAVLTAAINEKAESDSHLPRFFSVSNLHMSEFDFPVRHVDEGRKSGLKKIRQTDLALRFFNIQSKGETS